MNKVNREPGVNEEEDGVHLPEEKQAKKELETVIIDRDKYVEVDIYNDELYLSVGI